MKIESDWSVQNHQPIKKNHLIKSTPQLLSQSSKKSHGRERARKSLNFEHYLNLPTRIFLYSF